jgi:hypothetical protein
MTLQVVRCQCEAMSLPGLFDYESGTVVAQREDSLLRVDASVSDVGSQSFRNRLGFPPEFAWWYSRQALTASDTRTGHLPFEKILCPGRALWYTERRSLGRLSHFGTDGSRYWGTSRVPIQGCEMKLA